MTISVNNEIVPVLTFHSVGMNEPSWVFRQLSEQADAFEDLLRTLRARDYRTVSLDDLYAHMAGERQCAARSVVLVFDDGYLDNWVTVGPLLKKYGMCGTVYVNPDFVDPGDELRPTMDDAADARQTGFMNWAELRHLDQSGILDVQSHSLTHTWYFKGPQIIDFYRPSSAAAYPWMAWNAQPARKPFYLSEDQSAFVTWGTPVFEFEKSLLTRRFKPDADSIDALIDRVGAAGGVAFFDTPGWRENLEAYVADIAVDGKFPGSTESETGYEARVRDELMSSKAIIERQLDKTVEYLCWPGGGVNDVARRLAAEVGYKSWTLPSGEQVDKRNKPGEDPTEIKRLPAIRDVRFFNRKWGVGKARLVYLEMLSHQASRWADLRRKAYKLGVAAGIAGQR